MSFKEAEEIYERFGDVPMKDMGPMDIRLWQLAMSVLQDKREMASGDTL